MYIRLDVLENCESFANHKRDSLGKDSWGACNWSDNPPVGTQRAVCLWLCGPMIPLNRVPDLPSGWQAYPGMHVSGGEVIGDPAATYTGDQCIDLCQNNDTCFAVDFDSETGGCYSLSEDLKCENLASANHVYHAKKPPVCGT